MLEFLDFDDELDMILEARQKAEEEGKTSFICPSCGGVCHWIRTKDRNYHFLIYCEKCGIQIRGSKHGIRCIDQRISETGKEGR